MICDGHVIGIIDSESTIENRYDDSDLEILQAMANIASLRVRSALANQATEKAISEGAHFKSLFNNERDSLKTVLNSIQDGIVAIDSESKIQMFSQTASKLTGWSVADAIGKQIQDVLHLLPPMDLTNRPIGTVAKQRGILRSKAEKEVEVEWKISPINSNAKSIGRVIVLRDVERELFLEQEAEKAQRIESLGVLAGGIAHDFNNNLQAIVASIEAARISGDDSGSPFLETAEKACQRSQVLASQLLTFAKGGSPKLETIDLEPILHHAADLGLSGSKSIANFQLEGKIPPITADKAQMEQVFGNLVLNAVQSMPHGGTVEISGKTTTFPGTQDPAVQISISDQGAGISTANLERIFDPYFTTKGTGNGLGLTISYSIIQRHKGEIAVDSELGVGTTITVLLKPGNNELLSIQHIQPDKQSFTAPKRILLLDDNELVLEGTTRLLETLGHQVIAVRNCNDAIEQCRERQNQSPFEIALLDLTIPGELGGAKTGEALLTIDPNIKIIVTSGYTSSTVMARHKELGFSGAIAKPFNHKNLTQAIQSACLN